MITVCILILTTILIDYSNDNRMYISLYITNSAKMKVKIMARIAITTIVAIISSTISLTAINIDSSKAGYSSNSNNINTNGKGDNNNASTNNKNDRHNSRKSKSNK